MNFVASQPLKFLGHYVRAEGVSADPDHIQDILAIPEPANKTQLQSFLRSVNQLGEFSLKITKLTLPFRALLRKDSP